MTSERQKVANRENALRSTGPKTPEGKAAVRFNSLRHGALAQTVVLPGEDAEAFENLRNEVWANYSPVGPIEEFLVTRTANIMWRLQRLGPAEAGLYHWRMHGIKAHRLAEQVCSYESRDLELSFPPRIGDEAAHSEAKKALEEAEYEINRDKLLVARAIHVDTQSGDTVSKINRYEKSLERQLFRILDELRRLQNRRRNRSVPPISDAITAE